MPRECSLSQIHGRLCRERRYKRLLLRRKENLDRRRIDPSCDPKLLRVSIGILMAALLMLLLALSLCIPPKMAVDLPNRSRLLDRTVPPEITLACQASQYPELCQTSLTGTPIAKTHPGPAQIIQAAMGLSSEGVKESYALSRSILANTSGDSNVTRTVENCLELLDASIRWVARSSGARLDERIKDVKAWMSAALLYQYDCNSALKYVNTTQEVINLMNQIQSVMNLTSNALSMADALDTYGTNTTLWRPPRTERTSNSTRIPAPNGNPKGSFPAVPGLRDVAPNIIVSGDNSSGFSSIQSAVDAAPDGSAQRFVIYIKAGVYREIVRVPPRKTNLMFLGDGAHRTIITGSMSSQHPGSGTYTSATVGVNADGFVARDIAFVNAAGPGSHQAVALRVDSDLSAFHNCAFVGHQDTLYAHALRQYYRDSVISGTVDFIFGNSASVFHGCSILVRPRLENSSTGESDTVTAQGRTDPAQSTGFVFWNCSVNGTGDYTRDFLRNPKLHRAYLGRPWKMYSRTVFLGSYLGSLIRPEGWLAWDGDFALDTLYYGEFNNYGPGANVSGRVPWSNQIPPPAVEMYSDLNFVQANEWLPVAA